MWMKIGLRIQDPPLTLTLFDHRLSTDIFRLSHWGNIIPQLVSFILNSVIIDLLYWLILYEEKEWQIK